jgi:DNA-binding transcriptional LysR family regulator
MKISIRQLELFVKIAQLGNVTKAAKALFLSQSAASMGLLELEKQLDTPLFDRVGKKLSLNSNGEYLFSKAKEIIERILEFENFHLQKKNQLVGNLNIGASTTIGNYILPQNLNNFINDNPEIKVHIYIENTKEIIEKILSLEIDLAYIEGTCSHPEILVETWRKDELVFCCSPNFPLAKKKKLKLSDIQKPIWILREIGSGTRHIFEKNFGATHLSPESILLEMSSTEAIKEALISGMGVSCLSFEAIKREIKAGDLVLLNIDEIKITRYFYKLVHKRKYITNLIKSFAEYANYSSKK